MNRPVFKLSKVCDRKALILIVNYYGGDADTEHFQFDNLNHCIISNSITGTPNLNLELIKQVVEFYTTLGEILGSNAEYEEILEVYGKEYASAYENVPNDPSTDYQTKCKLDNLSLNYYTESGDLYTASI